MYSLEGKEVFITGAAGSIGGHLIERLEQEKVGSIGVLTRSLEKAKILRSQGLVPYVGEIDQIDTLSRELKRCEIIYHLAGWMGLPRESEEARRVNVGGTKSIVEAASKAGVSKIVFLSSIAVYGNQDDKAYRVTESTDLNPQSAYGKTKAEAEGIIVASELDYTILRPGMLMGPKIYTWTGTIHDSLQRTFLGWRGIPPLLIGEGYGSFNLCYIGDLTEAMIRSATYPEASRQIFNVVSQTVKWNEVISAYEREMGVKASHFPESLARMVGRIGDLIPTSSINSVTVDSATNIQFVKSHKIQQTLDMKMTPGFVALERSMDWLRQRDIS